MLECNSIRLTRKEKLHQVEIHPLINSVNICTKSFLVCNNTVCHIYTPHKYLVFFCSRTLLKYWHSCTESFKVTVSWDCWVLFFLHQIAFPGPMTCAMGQFCLLLNIHCDIQRNVCSALYIWYTEAGFTIEFANSHI